MGNYDHAARLSRPTIYLLGACAVWPLAMRLLLPVLAASRILRMNMAMYGVISGLRSILALTAIIFFLVWFYRIVVAMRREQGDSRYSPGLSVGCWFIPGANFVMPYFAVSDAWNRLMTGDARGWIVPLWWGTYLALIVLNIVVGGPHVQNRELWMTLGYLTTLLAVAAYGSLLLIVQWITQRTTGGASFPVR
jgi:hypothetical protein